MMGSNDGGGTDPVPGNVSPSEGKHPDAVKEIGGPPGEADNSLKPGLLRHASPSNIRPMLD